VGHANYSGYYLYGNNPSGFSQFLKQNFSQTVEKRKLLNPWCLPFCDVLSRLGQSVAAPIPSGETDN
jgi:hypothetical protein